MMKRLRITLEKVRLLATVGFVAGVACVLIPGTGAAFSNGSLTGGYGCLGQATINNNTTTGIFSGISEVMRLGLDGAGHVKGKMILNLGGEVCTIAATGSYSVNFGGLGSMTLNWVTATGDADGDTNCGTALNPLAVTQHMSLVIEHNGASFDFQGDDDFLTATTVTGDSGDVLSPFTGSCKTQS
jgi:hypothetical protein